MTRSLKTDLTTLSNAELSMIASRVADEQARRTAACFETLCSNTERKYPGRLCLVVDEVGWTGGMGPWVHAKTAGGGWFQPGDVFSIDGMPWDVIVREFLTEPAVHGWVSKLVAPTWAPVGLRAVSKDAPRLEKILKHGSVLVQKVPHPPHVCVPGEREERDASPPS